MPCIVYFAVISAVICLLFIFDYFKFIKLISQCHFESRYRDSGEQMKIGPCRPM